MSFSFPSIITVLVESTRADQDNIMAEENHPEAMAYPKKGSLNRLIYKLPLLLWRLGLGPYLSHPARGGKKMLVVTTRGRKSGLPRRTMLSYITNKNKNYVVSGWWLRADWVKNFHKDPLVTIQTWERIYSAHARRVEDIEELRGVAQALFGSGGDSHFDSWLEDLGIEPNLDDLLAKRERVFMIGFDPVDEDGPQPLLSDLLWIWAIIISFLLGLIFFLI